MLTKADLKLSHALQDVSAELSEMLAEKYGERIGFVLITAPFFKEPTEIQYVTNCDNQGAEALVTSLSERMKKGLPHIPAHKKD